ncbi:hypothetical protein BYT27DRAFT_7265230 [Phlegmacium glaucopus]|nr:hypothetical protein BYT27DRAFT_7265230 [Phlegmacium glaucopus]
MATAASLTQKSPSTYEFTKRKRWPDLLVTGLVDSVLFILSPSCIILYVATAVNELLGWRDVDLVDLDFIKLINSADHIAFRNGFEHSKHEVESSLQVRLICNVPPESQLQTSKELFVEIKLYPQKICDNTIEIKCVFATVTPFPSRNTAVLNTLLELKAENQRLLRKVMDHKSRISVGSSTSTQLPVSSQVNPMYALHPPSGVLSTPGITGQKNSDSSSSFDQGAALGSNFTLDFTETIYGSNANLEEINEGSKKKKLKKAQGAEQYVCITCGRTDSPEWRKGPLGPKTLCNACGLRWAKQMRKVDDPLLEGAPQSSCKYAEV